MSRNWFANTLCAVSALLTAMPMANAQQETTDTMVYDGKRIKVTFVVNDKLDSNVVRELERSLMKVDSNWQSDDEPQTVEIERKIVIKEDSQDPNSPQIEEIEIRKEEMELEMEKANAEIEKAEEEIARASEEMELAMEEAEEEMERSMEEQIEQRIEMGIKKNSECEDNSQEFVVTNWFVMDLGFNNMVDASQFIRMPSEYKQLSIDPATSLNFHLGVIQQGIRIDKQGKFRLVYGAGVEYNNYRFENDVDLEKNKEEITFTENEERDYKKNKLVTQFVTVPLMLHFKSDPVNDDKSFNVALGVQWGYLFRSQQKQKWKEGGQNQKTKVRGDYNLNETRYGYVAQFGYGNFNIYGKYYPTPVFRTGEGPEMYTAALGIVLIPF